MRDAATTVLNGIRESIDGSREKNVNFVMVSENEKVWICLFYSKFILRRHFAKELVLEQLLKIKISL